MLISEWVNLAYLVLILYKIEGVLACMACVIELY